MTRGLFPPAKPAYGEYDALPAPAADLIGLAEQWIVSNALHVTAQKVARFLLRHSQQVGSRIQVTGKRVAKMIGMSVSTAGRWMRRLRDLGFFTVFKEHVTYWEDEPGMRFDPEIGWYEPEPGWRTISAVRDINFSMFSQVSGESDQHIRVGSTVVTFEPDQAKLQTVTSPPPSGMGESLSWGPQTVLAARAGLDPCHPLPHGDAPAAHETETPRRPDPLVQEEGPPPESPERPLKVYPFPPFLGYGGVSQAEEILMKDSDFPADVTEAEVKVFSGRSTKAFRMWRDLNGRPHSHSELAEKYGLVTSTVANYLKELVTARVVEHRFIPHSIYSLGHMPLQVMADAMDVKPRELDFTYPFLPNNAEISFEGKILGLERGIFSTGNYFVKLTVSKDPSSTYFVDCEECEDDEVILWENDGDARRWGELTSIELIDPFDDVTFATLVLRGREYEGQEVRVTGWASQQYLYLGSIEILE